MLKTINNKKDFCLSFLTLSPFFVSLLFFHLLLFTISDVCCFLLKTKQTSKKIIFFNNNRNIYFSSFSFLPSSFYYYHYYNFITFSFFFLFFTIIIFIGIVEYFSLSSVKRLFLKIFNRTQKKCIISLLSLCAFWCYLKNKYHLKRVYFLFSSCLFFSCVCVCFSLFFSACVSPFTSFCVLGIYIILYLLSNKHDE